MPEAKACVSQAKRLVEKHLPASQAKAQPLSLGTSRRAELRSQIQALVQTPAEAPAQSRPASVSREFHDALDTCLKVEATVRERRSPRTSPLRRVSDGRQLENPRAQSGVRIGHSAAQMCGEFLDTLSCIKGDACAQAHHVAELSGRSLHNLDGLLERGMLITEN